MVKFNLIYEISFDDNIYIGSTCETLKTRLNQLMEDLKSTVYKSITIMSMNQKLNPLFCSISGSVDKKGLEAVENKQISELADKYEDRVLNKRDNPNKRRRLESMSKLKQ